VDLSYAPDVTTEHWPAETWQRVVKAGWERSTAAVVLVLLAPLLLVLAVAVRLDSRGAAVFRQVRVGQGGRPFTLFKFRTMAVDAGEALAELRSRNEVDGPLFKLRADPRITRVGGMLRRYSLDELPQLWNVVRGEMALIGPRPALPDEVAAYDELAARRLAVKPGLTGLWQVSGRSDLPWHEAVRLDVQYVEQWSLGLDLRILGRTPGAVLGHRGAY
jgi:lipopolysaccharide/colanic/teichoic acid biosynthesis glycosyltransferase